MLNGSGKLSKSKKVAYTSFMIALAIALRLIKASLFGPFQFINFPGVFTIVSGITFGPVTGMVVGVGSYLFSDILLGLPGPWTAVNATFMGAVGLLCGIIWKRSSRTGMSKIGVGVGAYVIMLAFDVISSVVLWRVTGYEWGLALVMGVAGLFLPAGGGFMYAIGPITEAATAILVVSIVHTLRRNKSIRSA